MASSRYRDCAGAIGPPLLKEVPCEAHIGAIDSPRRTMNGTHKQSYEVEGHKWRHRRNPPIPRLCPTLRELINPFRSLKAPNQRRTEVDIAAPVAAVVAAGPSADPSSERNF